MAATILRFPAVAVDRQARQLATSAHVLVFPTPRARSRRRRRSPMTHLQEKIARLEARSAGAAAVVERLVDDMLAEHGSGDAA